MRILLDENLDEELPEFLPGHDVFHVNELGWHGTSNGQLLRKAQEAGFEAFVRADKNMPYQQSMKGRPFPLIVLDVHPNVLMNQAACVPMIERHIKDAQPGHTYVTEGPHSRRPKE